MDVVKVLHDNKLDTSHLGAEVICSDESYSLLGELFKQNFINVF